MPQPPYGAVIFRGLKNIDLYTNFGCNRRCIMCFLTDKQLASRCRMSLQLIRSILRWAKAMGSRIEEVTLLGGEFSLHPHAAQIIVEVGYHLRVRVVTNGCRQFRKLLGKRKVVEILRRGSVSVSW